ncbi:hypothetical protein RSAG8_01002, partial [Rhizoctonia solani AG-8 WAC10335]
MNALAKLFSLLGVATEHPSSTTQDDYQLPKGSPDMSSLSCFEFGLDSRTGFLPTQVPLARLPATFDKWEDALQRAMVVLKHPGDSDDPPPTDEEKEQSLRWRENIKRMEVIGIDSLKSDRRAAQRAHHVLAFLVQFYVQSLPPRAESDLEPIRIPSSLAIPHLDIAPILTYADCVLWNFYLEDPSKPLTLENIRIRDLFTKDYQEEHFFLTSARIEVRGFEAIQLMGDAIAMTRKAQEMCTAVDETCLQDTLARLAVVIDDLSRILWAVRDACGYQFFYWVFRPWIRGTDQGYGSPKWLYEGVDGEGIEFQCSGPSAGQAALMHAFDEELRSFLLDEAAYLTPPPEKMESTMSFPSKPPISLERPANLPTPPSSPYGSPVLSATNPDRGEVPKLQPQTDLDTSFIVRMRKYIPGNHQQFLLHLAHSNIRPHVAICSNSGVRRAYNDCVWAIKRFRDTHIKIVTLYVTHPARSKVLVKDAEAESAPVRGTGGTSLVPLLKAYRNNTANTMFQTD